MKSNIFYAASFVISALISMSTAVSVVAQPLSDAKSTTQSPPPSSAAFLTDAAIRAILDKRIADKKAIGVSVALIEADGTTRFISAGSAAGGGRPGQTTRAEINADTIFEIGSITKTFTGTILAQMVAANEKNVGDGKDGKVRVVRIALDGRVRQYAPSIYKFRGDKSAGDITLLQLATHTSGLPRLPTSTALFFAMMTDMDNPYKNYPVDAMWKYIADEKMDMSKTYPSNYSNLGVGLLGDLLAENAGLRYDALVKRQILDPLSMTDTAMGDNAAATEAPIANPRLAVGHDAKLKPVAYWTFGSMSGAGGLRSTARDMARYMTAQKNGTLAGASAAQTPRVKVNDNMDIGLCWMTLKRHNDEIVWHNGGTGGFRSFAGFSQKTGLGIVVLSNSANSVDDIGLHLLNAAYKLQ
jgi:serine-type D-Ala-D-Ala carboxypeptidase/endopeptidase